MHYVCGHCDPRRKKPLMYKNFNHITVFPVETFSLLCDIFENYFYFCLQNKMIIFPLNTESHYDLGACDVAAFIY